MNVTIVVFMPVVHQYLGRLFDWCFVLFVFIVAFFATLPHYSKSMYCIVGIEKEREIARRLLTWPH
jgi:hypothetical protein